MRGLIDSHCHLHDRQFFSAAEAEEILRAAREKGVTKIVCIGTDPEDSRAAQEFASTHEDVYWTYGVHPEEWEKGLEYGFSRSYAPTWRGIASEPRNDGRERADREKPVQAPIAIGEVGLDYHSDGYNREAQIKLFEQMLQLAVDHDLPVSFHVRNAFEDFFPVVENFPKVRGVVHSFTDSKKTLRKILETTDFYVGVNGLATYSTLPTPPLDRILLETDAPFLTPVPHRGEKNGPNYIPEIAAWLAEKLGTDVETIAAETTKNCERLFRF